MEALFNDLNAGEICADELRDPKLSIFNEEDDETNVTMLRSVDSGSAFQRSLLNSTCKIEQQICSIESNEIKIILITSDDSFSPLNITKPGMEHTLRTLNVPSSFLGVITSMGQPPHEAEHGSGHVVENRYADGSFDISYLSRYYAFRRWEDGKHVRGSWRMRQIGVYHSFCAPKDCHTFIFLQPELESLFHLNMLRMIDSKRQASLMHCRPMIPHAMLLSCYVGDWRTMIRQRGDEFLVDKENLLAQKLKDLKVEARFKRLQFWYDLEDRLVPLESVLQSTQTQLETFQQIDTFFTTVHASAPVDAGSECFSVLSVHWFSSHKKIINNFLIEITLELNNQRKLGSINRTILDLNKKNHIGAENIKVITILTLLFLPASLVSSFFGMNFFDFSETTHSMTKASNTWLYAAVTIPLLALTVLLWQFVVWCATVDGNSEHDEEEKLVADDD